VFTLFYLFFLGIAFFSRGIYDIDGVWRSVVRVVIKQSWAKGRPIGPRTILEMIPPARNQCKWLPEVTAATEGMRVAAHIELGQVSGYLLVSNFQNLFFFLLISTANIPVSLSLSCSHSLSIS